MVWHFEEGVVAACLSLSLVLVLAVRPVCTPHPPYVVMLYLLGDRLA